MATLLASHQILASVRDNLSRTSDDPEEIRWVAAARTGDQHSIRLLLQRYRTRAIRLAAHVLRSDADAEDIAQEAFVRAFRSLRSLKADAGYWPWLARIVVRLCLDRQRRAFWQRETSADIQPWAGTVVDSSGAELRVLVGQLLDQLSPPMRAALVLSDLEGMDYSEVASVLGVPIGTVRSRLHTARSQFRILWLAANREEAVRE